MATPLLLICVDCEEGDHAACDRNEPEFWDSGICDCRNRDHTGTGIAP